MLWVDPATLTVLSLSSWIYFLWSLLPINNTGSSTGPPLVPVRRWCGSRIQDYIQIRGPCITRGPCTPSVLTPKGVPILRGSQYPYYTGCSRCDCMRVIGYLLLHGCLSCDLQGHLCSSTHLMVTSSFVSGLCIFILENESQHTYDHSEVGCMMLESDVIISGREQLWTFSMGKALGSTQRFHQRIRVVYRSACVAMSFERNFS